MINLWIVSGPSSVGKSTFIRSQDKISHISLPDQLNVIFPDSILEPGSLMPEKSIIHYNILRPIVIRYQSKYHANNIRARLISVMRRAKGLMDRSSFETDWGGATFRLDQTWERIRSFPTSKKAIILVANRNELMARILKRKTVEDSFEYPGPHQLYNSQFWQRIYEGIDLAALYVAWCRELERSRIEYVVLDSTAEKYSRIDSIRTMMKVINQSSRG